MAKSALVSPELAACNPATKNDTFFVWYLYKPRPLFHRNSLKMLLSHTEAPAFSSPILPFPPHRSSPLSQSLTPCSTSIVRFCAKELLQPSHSPLCPCSSWSKPLTTTPPSLERTCPARLRPAATQPFPLVATLTSHREASISSSRLPTSSTSISIPPHPRASHLPLSARRRCLNIIITNIVMLITSTIIIAKLRSWHLKVAPMRLWGDLHPSSPQIVLVLVEELEMGRFLFWRGFHHHPLPAGAWAQPTCRTKPPQGCPLTWTTLVEV